jgi:hypothetical protein
MPDLFRPLFKPDLLKSRTAHFALAFAPAQRQVAENWARTAADPAFRAEREKPFQGQSLAALRQAGRELPGSRHRGRVLAWATGALHRAVSTANLTSVGAKPVSASLFQLALTSGPNAHSRLDPWGSEAVSTLTQAYG